MVDFSNLTASRLSLPTIRVGADWRIRMFLKTSQNIPIDLTGCSAIMQIRLNINAVTVLHELSTVNGKIVISPQSGIIELQLLDDETRLINWGRAEYAIMVNDSLGFDWVLCEGRIKAKRVITHV